MPFHVVSGDQDVEVLGTHFNINSYTDEQVIRTTLLEGSVKVTQKLNNTSKLLAPGQESANNGGTISVAEVNTAAAVSWKNGYFTFKKADVRTVMRQFERWYDIEVVYEGHVPKRELTGDVYRNVSGEKALKILSYFNVHFRKDGRKITITD